MTGSTAFSRNAGSPQDIAGDYSPAERAAEAVDETILPAYMLTSREVPPTQDCARRACAGVRGFDGSKTGGVSPSPPNLLRGRADRAGGVDAAIVAPLGRLDDPPGRGRVPRVFRADRRRWKAGDGLWQGLPAGGRELADRRRTDRPGW